MPAIAAASTTCGRRHGFGQGCFTQHPSVSGGCVHARDVRHTKGLAPANGPPKGGAAGQQECPLVPCRELCAPAHQTSIADRSPLGNVARATGSV
eukprot:9466135-Pyramimonas_sp.AAC.3